MQHEDRTLSLLWTIRDSGRFIIAETAGVTFESYISNRRLRSAVEREFEIIGEAARRLSNADPFTATRITDIARIIAFRNRLAHGYDVVNHEQVLEVVEHFLPRLISEVDAMLSDAGPGEKRGA